MDAPWTPDTERTGPLKACWCGHPMGFHPARPLWFGSTHMSQSCTFCDCKSPEEMPVQPPEAWFVSQTQFDAWLARLHAWFKENGFARTT